MNEIICGDCLAVMPTLPENSVDSIITDPPYGLGFMGKSWDHGVPGVEFWQAALRVAKPGAVLMAFGGTRTFHRLACAIEDAGWELRDTMCWLYGSGFPKSLDISKAIDKAAGAEREIVGVSNNQPAGFIRHGRTNEQVFLGTDTQKTPASLTAPATPAARQWQGWGTALKPAHEDIIVAMKPLDGTYAENAQKWGVAGLNIDGARVQGPKGSGVWGSSNKTCQKGRTFNRSPDGEEYRSEQNPQGRWPANLILDEDSAELLDQQSDHASRFFYTAKASASERNAGLEGVVTWEDMDLKEDFEKVLSLARDTSDVLIPLQDDSAWLTTLFGNNSTVLSLTGMKSTIATVTNLITVLRTSNFLLTSNTSGSILAATKTLMADGSNLADIVDRLNKLIQSSMSEQTVSVLGAVLAVLRRLLPISEKGRRGNIHSTVKPVDLMRYLCKLTKTPTGGVVLDPFMGSGTTGVACVLEHRDFIGVEISQEYVEIAKKRIGDAVGPLFKESDR